MSKHAQYAPQSTSEAMKAVDERLRQLSRDILPSAPYQLKVDKEIRNLDPRQAIEWRRGCPFEPHEELLQYLTFRSNSDRDTIFHVVGDWDDGNGNIMSKTDKTSGLSTPLLGQPPKKKITLSDYKNKAGGHVSTPVSASAERNGETKPVGAGSRPTSQARPESKPVTKQAPRGVKRSLDDESEYKEKKEDASPPPQPPPSKKVCVPPTTAPTAQPATPEKPAAWKLPPMLSPTLPSDIEEDLARLRRGAPGRDGKNDPTAKSTPEKISPSNALPLKENSRHMKVVSKELARSIDRSGKTSPALNAAKSNHERLPTSSSTQRSRNVTAKGVAISKSSAKKDDFSDKKGLSSPAASSSALQTPEKKSLVAKLKIPKSLRKNCIRILQMQPRPTKKMLEQDVPKHTLSKMPSGKSRDKVLPNGRNRDAEPQLPRPEHSQGRSSPLADRPERKVKALEDQSSLPRSGDKRKNLHDGSTNTDSTSKRQKQPAKLDLAQKPHTPIKTPLKSPLVAKQVSAQKSHLSTPQRDLKSTAMQRIGSAEGDVQTPGAARGGTPTANGTSERVNRDGRSSSNTSSGGVAVLRNEEVVEWRSEQKKLEALGRTLKHEAKVSLPPNGDFRNDSPSMKRGAAIAFEAALAFVLAFAVGDEINRLIRQPQDAAPWRTVVPFLHYVQRVTRIYQSLLGLTYQLEALCRDLISHYDAERLEREVSSTNVPEEQRPSTSDSALSNLSPSITDKARQDSANLHVKLAENMRQAQNVWQVGYSELSLNEMQRCFPDTWSKRADLPGPGKGKEKLSPKRCSEGPYYLPLGPTTSGVEGVRVGWQMLKEWTERNEVEWVGKLEF